MRNSAIGLIAGLALALPAAAGAGGTCSLDGRLYPENAVVCSGGLVTYCSNGIWQSNDGSRCDTATGSYLTPLRPYRARNNEPIPKCEHDQQVLDAAQAAMDAAVAAP
jgi:hypothetical protein